MTPRTALAATLKHPAALLSAIVLLSVVVLVPAWDAPAVGQDEPAVAAGDESPFYDLAKHGAVPGQDCTEALQHALDTMQEHQKPILLPAGPLLISKTIVTPFATGGKIVGSGRGQWVMPGTSLNGAVTSLVWTGEPGGTILKIQGSHMDVTDLAIYGARNPKMKKRAGIGIVVTKPARGLGTGKLQFNSLYIQNCDVGFQVGERPNQHNCDNLVFGYFLVKQCDVGFRAVNGQAVGFKFDYVQSVATGTTFDFRGGGNLWVDAWKIISGDVGLNLQDENDPVTIGSNNACYSFGNIKLDNNADEFTLVREVTNRPVMVVLNHGHIGSNVTLTEPFIEVQGNTIVTMRDWYNLRTGMIVGKEVRGQRPNIVLDRCRLAPHNGPGDFLEGQGRLKLRDCVEGKTWTVVEDAVVER